jgi:hexosaminidase
MKLFFKILKNTVIFLAAFLVMLVLFLYVYYGILARQISKQEKAELAAAVKRPAIRLFPDQPAGTGALNLLPVPQQVEFRSGVLHFPEQLTCQAPPDMKIMVGRSLAKFPGVRTVSWQPGAFLKCLPDTTLPEEGYKLELSPSSAIVRYSSARGLHYGLITIKVLMINYGNAIPCLRILDSPDLKVRGLMLDVSRDKVPTLATLLGLVELLADLKYNHLELYTEGFSFAYPSFKSLWEGRETPLTGAEIRQLDSLCRENFIDLVPNQNSLGHMDAWLATDEYKDLAECPDGFKLMGLITMKSTLDPYDKRSIELVSRMTDDLLPNYTSPNFNVNLDEPFELGKGKSKKISHQKGIGNVYLDYVLKMHDMVTARNRKMLIWGDIALRQPEILSKLPKDITLLDWGYEALYPFERNARKLDSAGVKFMECPGTSSWTTIIGRTKNMMDNIETAAVSGKKYGARGLLVTDWGDMGHWQYLPVSYAGYVTAAALGWNCGSRSGMPLQQFLDSYVFRDKAGTMAGFVLNMGSYNQFEEFPMFNMTTTMMTMQLGLRDKVMENAIFEKGMTGLTSLMKDIAPDLIDTVAIRYRNRISYDNRGLNGWLDQQELVLRKTRIGVHDSALIKDEYSNAIRLIRLGSRLKQYIRDKGSLTVPDELEHLDTLDKLCTAYLTENHRLWLIRNKPGGYEKSIASLTGLQTAVRKRMELLHKPWLNRSLNRFVEKISSAGLAIYMKMIA